MDKYERRRIVDITLEEYEGGFMGRGLSRRRINEYIETIGGDNWINDRIKKYNIIKDKREEEKDE